MEPSSGGRATDGIGINSGHTGSDNSNGHSSHIHKSSCGRATDGIGTNSSHTGSDNSSGGHATDGIGTNSSHTGSDNSNIRSSHIASNNRAKKKKNFDWSTYRSQKYYKEQLK
jgi:hypothetical protein